MRYRHRVTWGIAALSVLLWAGSADAAWTKVATLTASDGAVGDAFGGTIEFDGDRVLVAARTKDVGEATDAGAAYLFTSDGLGGYVEKRLLPNHTLAASDGFGTGVCFSGDLAFVSAPRADFSTYTDAGAVWIFQKDQGGLNNWGQVAMLTASDPQGGASFGGSIAAFGDTLLVGSSGVATNDGAAYIFEKDGLGNWNQVQKITTGATDKRFGQSCDIDGDTLVVGAYYGNNAYVYEKEGGSWLQKKILTATGLNPTSQNFGVGTSIDGDTIVVGAYRQKVGTLTYAGSAYVYDQDNGGEDNWGLTATLTASDPQASANFGNNTGLLGNRLAVSAVNADGQDGALYYFENDGLGNWVQMERISNGITDEGFGLPVALAGDLMAVGARENIAGAIGNGKVYIYAVPEPTTWALILTGFAALIGFARRKGGHDMRHRLVWGIAALSVLLGAGSADAAWTKMTTLTASDGASGDAFGGAIEYDGSRILIGARTKDVGGAVDAGGAYLFTSNGIGGFVEKQILPNETLTAGDAFGTSVCFSGDLAFVSAYKADVTTGSPFSTTYTDAGAVWVFQKDLGGTDNWGQVAMLTASDIHDGATFGSSIAVSGNTLLVGSTGATTNDGAAYVFEQDGFGNWNEIQKLTSGVADKRFGQTCDMDGNTMLVGAYYGNNAYVYEKEAGAWVQKVVLTAEGLDPTKQNFGVGASVDGDTIVVGGYRQKVGETTYAGAAYVFDRDNGGEDNWGLTATLTASDPQANASFGNKTALLGDRLAISAVGADDADGVLYYFEKDSLGNWVQMERISNGVTDEGFGLPVALADGLAAVSARENVEGAIGNGKVYIYSVTAASNLPGDTDNDGDVDDDDAATLAANWLATVEGGVQDGDFNNDYVVDDRDAAILAAHWVRGGSTEQSVPEPSVLVLALGGVVVGWATMLRRRRS